MCAAGSCLLQPAGERTPSITRETLFLSRSGMDALDICKGPCSRSLYMRLLQNDRTQDCSHGIALTLLLLPLAFLLVTILQLSF